MDSGHWTLDARRSTLDAVKAATETSGVFRQRQSSILGSGEGRAVGTASGRPIRYDAIETSPIPKSREKKRKMFPSSYLATNVFAYLPASSQTSRSCRMRMLRMSSETPNTNIQF
jgi:hypothetical protein